MKIGINNSPMALPKQQKNISFGSVSMIKVSKGLGSSTVKEAEKAYKGIEEEALDRLKAVFFHIFAFLERTEPNPEAKAEMQELIRQVPIFDPFFATGNKPKGFFEKTLRFIGINDEDKAITIGKKTKRIPGVDFKFMNGEQEETVRILMPRNSFIYDVHTSAGKLSDGLDRAYPRLTGRNATRGIPGFKLNPSLSEKLKNRLSSQRDENLDLWDRIATGFIVLGRIKKQCEEPAKIASEFTDKYLHRT